MLKTLDKKTLIELLKSYNEYIQTANEENKYSDGWYPVCIEEYYQNEFQEEVKYQ